MRYKLNMQGPEGETHSVRPLAGKARVMPLKRNVTPCAELSGLLVLSRLLTSLSLWDRFPEKPSRVSFFGDSECTINSVEAEETVLEEWFDNRVRGSGEYGSMERVWHTSG